MTNTTEAIVRRHTTAAGLIDFFFERFDTAHASDSELEYLAGFTGTVADMAESLSTLTAGIGMLVSADCRSENKHLRVEALQGKDEPLLLFHIAAEIELMARIAEVAADSNCNLQRRFIDRLKVERSRRGFSDEYSSHDVSHG
ncbi:MULTISPECIES: hypothetical protein [unclassified Caballeronia]|uniref:hypothetical protein n=1 Tax=unclassified Caballeronia TaxID=2646786 RepID=UPI002863C36D|nr:MULTISPECIES: hypothetical protein [unclassified Caballeronia]MDR5777732.1 hypothetical protein [Caballeronia sp. LZ002]MDR5800576.1 hypothetical protein [Caballeronia sp. LZ001]MDR5802517.1 hypothetical protein [Caballeronia sp. LZ001]MDR5853162.1 hypothetical protein [Caballeronia sp. LZ003]